MSSNKLSAKAAKLDFSRLPGGPQTDSPALPVPEVRPKTAPGAMMAFAADARSELMRENEQLREQAAEAAQLKGQLHHALVELGQWEDAKAAKLLDPKTVAASRFSNRHERNYSGPEFLALKADIEGAGGNVQPIKVRRLAAADTAGTEYELVFGHRRHRACLELGLPVLAVIDNLDDRTLFIEMDRENRARKDLSAWEQGSMYRSALRQGLFPSNRRLAEAIGVDLSAVGKALALADLPDEIVSAFNSPLDLQFRWAKPLADAVAANREGVLTTARSLQSQRGNGRSAKQVFEALLSAARGGVEPFHPPQPVVVDLDGEPAATLSVSARGEVQVLIAPEWQAHERLAELGELLKQFLRAQSARPQPVQSARRRRSGGGKPDRN